MLCDMPDTGGPRLSHSGPYKGVRRQKATVLLTLAIALSLQTFRGRGAHDGHKGQWVLRRRAVAVCHGTERQNVLEETWP